MSNQSVIIKSNRYGLNVVLDEQPDWDTIKKEVAEKFSASAKFFGNAQMALCFQGRPLSTAEEEELVEICRQVEAFHQGKYNAMGIVTRTNS